MPASRTVRLIRLGCARNDVDAEELAARLVDAGWRLTEAPSADVTVVNTCGFIEAAKQESIDTLLEAADGATRVVAVGCLAERYGTALADAMPEATILSFDDYPVIAQRLEDVLAGRPPAPHTPRDRRTLLPLTPVDRPRAAAEVGIPGHLGGPRVLRHRLDDSPVAPLKIASGCDRRCTFCAIPSFRGAFVSRPPADILREAQWLADHGAREIVLVSENSTSYGKDFGDPFALEKLLAAFGGVDGLVRVRVTYLQPAEVRPALIDVIATAPHVAPYFDLSFQHASPRVLRRMRRFGGSEEFLNLLAEIRRRNPRAAVRSNVIVGFPGETEEDVAELGEFLRAARLDGIGVFGYSDEDGTEASGFPEKIPEQEIRSRVDDIAGIAEEVTADRARARLGETVDVLIDGVDDDRPDACYGYTEVQAVDVDGVTVLRDCSAARGALVRAEIVEIDGVDFLAAPVTGSTAGTPSGATVEG